jgi:mRNA interferase HicA
VKRVDLIRYLERSECEFLREGGEHTVYVNRAARKSSSLPRHREINDFLARKICNDLQVPPPRSKTRAQ